LAVKNFGFSFYQKAFFFSNKKFQVINLLVKTIKVSLLFSVFTEKASQTKPIKKNIFASTFSLVLTKIYHRHKNNYLPHSVTVPKNKISFF
jgi:hypothetical protein